MNDNEKVKKSALPTETVCWGYKADNGPNIWGCLSPEYGLCADGMHQSPINIENPKPMKLPAIAFNYQPTTLNIGNTGNTIAIIYPEGSWIQVGGMQYSLLQFHFHSPSEHTVAAKQHDMEMHFVHKSGNGSLAVIAVFIENGRHNTAFDSIWQHLPSVPGESKWVADVVFNAIDLLPRTRHTYRYDGSLTTPPCSEGVKWIVLTTPIEMSEAQIAAFKSIMHGNNRPVQPLNGREVLIDKRTNS